MTALLQEVNAMEGGITALSIHFISTPGRGCQKEKGAEDRREGDQKTMIPPSLMIRIYPA